MSKIKKYLDNKGLTTLIDTLKKYFGRVKTVDGKNPDENGNVQLSWIGTKSEWEALDKAQLADKGSIKVYFTDVVKYESAVISTNYSTEEKIVGKWIDGRPLYQKTCIPSSAMLVSDTSTEYRHEIDNLDIVVNVSGTAYTAKSTTKTSKYRARPLNHYASDVNCNYVDNVGETTYIYIRTGPPYEAAQITFQYVKTTDISTI